ncbi:beta-N-acetylhexosaminidase [Polaribacter ponticola]|uniref:beta-N-acetylhexosaminidase n=1 Tax=Polaribacter ponticola TaxID=2978475 RepID=A0ABT5S4Q0_9FLAO|nr:family 20 glycosylhydrolase [Polaribacter sp. MSW5]MDD7913092.1 family 20 glycosylhydrolase [Polaribacter sp. MSW5]
MGTFRLTTRFIIHTTIILLLTACFKENKNPISSLIIPIPTEQVIKKGAFLLNSQTKLTFDKELEDVATFFKSYVENQKNIELNSGEKTKIHFKIDTSITNKEGYQLTISTSEITIAAKSQKGAFYAFQTIRQLLPSDFEASKENEFAIQCLEIKDAPRFSYRGMHLDVGRHFFSVDFIKKYLDLMSMLKMNTFHWHLTEDQGWRIEIKKYPKLQEIAAYRDETLIDHYNDQPHKFDGKKYGGFYTQEEIKEVVKYATERQITIIPEIEMPGHSQAAISAYPELGCTNEQVKVATKWGVFEEVYCPKESTFKFLEDVIDEVVALFPGKYIHIGGDEAPKTNWNKCKHCQKLIKKEGLKNEHELQSYFITRMEKYINIKGKQIIGWDEILEGGLAPNATVMSWRGTKGAIEAAKEKHNVILTPQSHCYFDHYQSTNENEPIAIGGFLPLEKVYSFNPIPKELTKEEAKYVLGAQGNVWTEYMQTPEKVEYMAFPRMIALSEVVWSKSDTKNYNEFVKRLEFFNKKLDVINVNYANHLYEVSGKLINKDSQISYQLETTTKGKNILFTTDGSNPLNTSSKYSDKIKIDKSVTIKAAVFNIEGKQLGNIFEQKINLHKAVGKSISLKVAPHKSYNAGGKQAFINGISGNNKRYGDKEWLGFNGDDVEITIEFDKPTDINSISTRFHNGNGQWIYAPKEVLISFDGSYFEGYEIGLSENLLVNFNQTFKHKKSNPNSFKNTKLWNYSFGKTRCRS